MEKNIYFDKIDSVALTNGSLATTYSHTITQNGIYKITWENYVEIKSSTAFVSDARYKSMLFINSQDVLLRELLPLPSTANFTTTYYNHTSNTFFYITPLLEDYVLDFKVQPDWTVGSATSISSKTDGYISVELIG